MGIGYENGKIVFKAGEGEENALKALGAAALGLGTAVSSVAGNSGDIALKVIGTTATGAAITSVAVGGSGVVSTAAGIGAAGLAAYAVADTLNDNQDVSVINHTAPKAMDNYEDYFNSFNTNHTGGNHDALNSRDNTYNAEDHIRHPANTSTTVDPKIAQALQHYSEWEGTMKSLGFIQVDGEVEELSSAQYGCPTYKVSRSNNYNGPMR